VARQVYDPETGTTKDFVSRYVSRLAPILWDRSPEVRKALKAK